MPLDTVLFGGPNLIQSALNTTSTSLPKGREKKPGLKHANSLMSSGERQSSAATSNGYRNRFSTSNSNPLRNSLGRSGTISSSKGSPFRHPLRE